MKLKDLFKKSAVAALALTLISTVAPASAKVGDIAETIYTTDILTRVNGQDINSFCVDGETLIAMEDLRDYGFTVTYDDSIRTLFVNRTGDTPQNMPEIARGKVGGTAGYTYETDINVLFNGTYINSYAIDGRMAAKVEDIGTALNDDDYEYGMTYTYDDSQRLLSLNNAPTESKEQQIAGYIDPTDKFSWSYDTTYNGSDFDLVVCGQSGTSHGSYTYYRQFMDCGRANDINQALYYYGFNDIWGHCNITVSDMKDDTLFFDGARNDGRGGSYAMDLHTYIVTALSETETDPDGELYPKFPTTENPDGKTAVAPSFDVFIDGVPVRACVVQNATYIDVNTLKAFGFEETFSNDQMSVLIKKGEGAKTAPEPYPAGTEMGTVSAAIPMIPYINGVGVSALMIDGKPMVRVDDLKITPFENYDICCGIDSVWDGALHVDTTMSKLPDYKTQLERVYSTYDDIPSITKQCLYTGNDYSVVCFRSGMSDGLEIFKVCSSGLVEPIARLMYQYGITAVDNAEISPDGRYLTVSDQADGKRCSFDLTDLTMTPVD